MVFVGGFDTVFTPYCKHQSLIRADWPLTSGMRCMCQFTLAVVSLHSFTLH